MMRYASQINRSAKYNEGIEKDAVPRELCVAVTQICVKGCYI